MPCCASTTVCMARTSSFCHPFLLATLSALIGNAACAQNSKLPQTIPESSKYIETSRVADVQRFVDACVGLSHGSRLTVTVAGKSHEGRAMTLVKVSLPEASDEQRLRALVIGNIHAGEVEGKEAVQELLREFAAGKHEALLKQCDVWFVPIYNLDGNEAVKVGNRRGQNGPDAVGQRVNAQKLDLNRDFV
ncbi:MAG: murein tripeptide amidase MpaA, partial [Planctomycetota bacterium]